MNASSRHDDTRHPAVGVVEALPQLFFSADADGVLDWVSPQWSRFFGGLTIEQWNADQADVVHPDDVELLRRRWLEATAACAEFRMHVRLRGAEAGYRWFDARAVPVTDDTGATRWYAAAVDVTEAHEAWEHLESEKTRYELLAASAPGVTVSFELGADGAGTVRYVSPTAAHILGVDPARIVADVAVMHEHTHPDDIVAFDVALAAELAAHPGEQVSFQMDIRYAHPQLGERWFDCRSAGAPMTGGGYRWQTHLVDITERKLNEAALFAERERAEVTLASIGDAVITTDAQSRVTYLNAVAETLTGWGLADAQGRDLDEIFELSSPDGRLLAENPAERCLREGHVIGLADHTVLRGRDGVERAIEDSAAPIRDASGTVLGCVLVFHDVTEARRLAGEVTHQASHDMLTGLVNRREFERRLQQVLDDVAETDAHHALLYLDLDQFKIVNDTGGHTAGDELLRGLATVLVSCVRSSDTVARLGGDEFGVILTDCPLREARGLAVTLREAIASFRFTWEGRVHRIGASIGLVPVTAGSGGLAEVLRAADSSCYLAKDAGRGRVHVYQADDASTVRRRGEMAWVHRIQEAIDRRDVVLHAQVLAPVRAVACAADRPARPGASVELLLRLRDDADGLV
ncbi:MAG: diguanylate cyclase, partial [Cellulomonadaceae bacterium]|nr:diguanylate cyclase [Cellulomonadaceae bacterium]